MQIADNFDYLTRFDMLNPREQEVLVNLLHKQQIDMKDAQRALEIRENHRTPLLSILGAMGFIDVNDYAETLADITHAPYVEDIANESEMTFDGDLIRQFSPAVMVRKLFCPLQHVYDFVVVMAVDPDEPGLEDAIHEVLPEMRIVYVISTEIQVKKIINTVFREKFSTKAINQLREDNPGQSAFKVITRAQKVVFLTMFALVIVGLAINFWGTARSLVVVISTLYVCGILYKLMLSVGSWFKHDTHEMKSYLKRLDDAELPIYSILVPVYKEPEVVPRLLKALSRIDYPREKLDVLLLMEEDDHETIASAKAANPPSFFRFIRVPASEPRTKPKACNYGLNFCRGEYVTIYDAEDIPESDQLRKAVAAFQTGGDDLICVQARLNYFNSHENYLTGMFTLEYTYWFDYLLPGLDRFKLPIPLGGTSNHFKLDKLIALGAWDPFNVTEDADLGIRASAQGYRVGVIDSTTYEEANKETVNWLRQRSRWIKGYMQTWLVHNRRPLQLLRQLGLKDWLSYQFFIGGTVWICLINPIMWGMFLIWILFQPAWMSNLFQGWVWNFAMFSLIVGNLSAILLNTTAALRRSRDRLLLYSITNPFYWVLHSIAAYIALYQLITKPFYWEKTNHGLTTVDPSHLLEKLA